MNSQSLEQSMAFIVFEGLDGAGKSTLIEALKEQLDLNKLDYIMTREPGGTPLAEELREIIIRDADETPVARAEILLYEAVRAQHVDMKIKPALLKKQWVICDRFTASTYAFQKGGRDLPNEQIHWLNNFATEGLEPDMNVLLDLPVEVSKARMENRVNETGIDKDRFEKEESDFHTRVRNAYLELSDQNKEKWIVLNATLSREELKKQFVSELKSRGILG